MHTPPPPKKKKKKRKENDENLTENIYKVYDKTISSNAAVCTCIEVSDRRALDRNFNTYGGSDNSSVIRRAVTETTTNL